MNIICKKLTLFTFISSMLSCTAPGGNENTSVSIKTTLGEIKILLYDGTPLHRDNFIRLINSSFYDGISFHRVIKDFMIQAGDPATKSPESIDFNDTLRTYTIPPEFNSIYFHKKGALAAARLGNDINPNMRSSGTQFYIVQGSRLSDEELNQSEARINSNIKQNIFNKILLETRDSVRMTKMDVSEAEIQEIASVRMFQYLTSNEDLKFSEEQRNIYKNLGGTPRLDGSYTVFGEVIEGLDIVDKIASVATDSNDRPLSEIRIIKMKILNK